MSKKVPDLLVIADATSVVLKYIIKFKTYVQGITVQHHFIEKNVTSFFLKLHKLVELVIDTGRDRILNVKTLSDRKSLGYSLGGPLLSFLTLRLP